MRPRRVAQAAPPPEHVQPTPPPPANPVQRADCLEAFRSFVESNINKVPALLVVTQRPRDLAREDLRQLKLTLDQAGFGEKSVQTAWRERKNEDVAATIIGYIRQLALGSPSVITQNRPSMIV